MPQKLCEIITDLLTRKNPDGSRQWTQITLAEKLGISQPTVSQMKTGTQWDDHFQVIKKLISEVEPMAVYDDPLTPRAVLHHLLAQRDKLPPQLRAEYWERIKDAAEEEFCTGKTQTLRDTGTHRTVRPCKHKKKK
jgi:transcriptional regulator with XRE-family HTH domain